MTTNPRRYPPSALEAMRVPELRTLCRERGWDFPHFWELKKSELVEKFLKEQERAQGR